MSMTLVFDASAAVKWFRPHEDGAAEARSLLEDAAADIWMPDHCVHEVVRTVATRRGFAAAACVWDAIATAGVLVGRVDGVLIAEALLVVDESGCDYYDALAPALARLVEGTLVSADRRAHGMLPEAVIVG